ncbi:MAG: putative PDDEXK endonuclease [Beijerinckiaceae bacterium]
MLNSRTKGQTGEREAAKLLTNWAIEAGVVLELERNLDQTRMGGHDLNGLEEYGLSVEVKRVETPAVATWWGQACRQAQSIDCAPMLMYRANRQPWRFRVSAFVYPCPDMLVIDLEAEPFKKWFVAHLRACVQRRAGLGLAQ